MKIKHILIAIFLIIIFPCTTKADCSNEKIAELSKIAANVQFSYNYSLNNEEIAYTVDVLNIQPDIYIEDNKNQKLFTDGNFTYYNTGVTIDYKIYSNDINCKNQLIQKRSINLPFYNAFSQTEECGEYPEFTLCQLWVDTSNISQTQFDEQFKKYLEKLVNKNDEISSPVVDDNEQSNESFYIILIIIGICLLLPLVLLRRKI